MICGKKQQRRRRKNHVPAQKCCGFRTKLSGYRDRAKLFFEKDLNRIPVGASLAHLEKLMEKHRPKQFEFIF